MNLKDFQQYLTQKGNYEARYKDSEGRDILVICELDVLAMVNDLVRAEREACAKVCEREQTPDEPYYQYDAGYEDGVKDCIAAIRARGAT